MYQTFFAVDGEVLPPDAVLKRTIYADTLEIIAEQGPDAFYQGEIAEGIVRAVQASGGLLTLRDLKGIHTS